MRRNVNCNGRSLVALGLAHVLLVGGLAHAGPYQVHARPIQVKQLLTRLGAPYCGIYSLYAAALVEGTDISFTDLLRKEYIGCARGSSFDELELAAASNHLYTLPFANLDKQALLDCGHPVILHVKAAISDNEYDHYALFLGTNDGELVIIDPTDPDAAVDSTELLTRWDGKGIVVSATPIDTTALFGEVRRRFLLWGALALIGALLLEQIYRRFEPSTSKGRGRTALVWLAQGGGIVIASVMASLVYNVAGGRRSIGRGWSGRADTEGE